MTNAGRRDRDLPWFAAKVEEWNAGETAKRHGKVTHEVLDGWGLLALQGPDAAAYLQRLTDADLSKLTFGKSAFLDVSGVRVHVARGGYTGEDGFEVRLSPPISLFRGAHVPQISIPPEHTVALAKTLSKQPVALTGLGARDSLRLEAGMCLYGQDLDEDTTPIEAGLTWVIGARSSAVIHVQF